MPTPEQVTTLIEAMDQLLDDMGEEGQCVSLYAKAKARIAFEPFYERELYGPEYYMSLETAKQIIKECDQEVQ